jgi:hypothetical protein
VCILWVTISGIHKNKNFSTINRRFLQHARLEGAPVAK